MPFAINEKNYALSVNVYHSLLFAFSYDDIVQKKKVDSKFIFSTVCSSNGKGNY